MFVFGNVWTWEKLTTSTKNELKRYWEDTSAAYCFHSLLSNAMAFKHEVWLSVQIHFWHPACFQWVLKTWICLASIHPTYFITPERCKLCQSHQTFSDSLAGLWLVFVFVCVCVCVCVCECVCVFVGLSECVYMSVCSVITWKCPEFLVGG